MRMWTKELPNKEGWYFYRMGKYSPKSSCFIKKRKYLDGFFAGGFEIKSFCDPYKVNGHLIQAMNFGYIESIDTGEWYGPIEI